MFTLPSPAFILIFPEFASTFNKFDTFNASAFVDLINILLPDTIFFFTPKPPSKITEPVVDDTESIVLDTCNTVLILTLLFALINKTPLVLATKFCNGSPNVNLVLLGKTTLKLGKGVIKMSPLLKIFN